MTHASSHERAVLADDEDTVVVSVVGAVAVIAHDGLLASDTTSKKSRRPLARTYPLK
jgi:hypothetical protein